MPLREFLCETSRGNLCLLPNSKGGLIPYRTFDRFDLMIICERRRLATHPSSATLGRFVN